MNKKITRWSLMNILFAILVSIPLWSIVVRTGYVLLNKNAYQSYSGSNSLNIEYKYTSNEINTGDDLIVGNIYQLFDFNAEDISGQNEIEFSFELISGSISFLNLHTDEVYGLDDTYIYPRVDYHMFLSSDDLSTLTLTYNNMTYSSYTFQGFNEGESGEDTIIRITFIDSIYDSNEGFFSEYFGFTTYNEIESINYTENTLDNVFDYSIDKFNEENDAHYDFVSNVANIFITEDSYGWRYVEFVNWYFNYFIVISAVYILFLCIIWFISICRRLIERSMNLW